MSDPKIRIRRSSTPNKVPTITQLELGELAINTYDGKLYLEQDQGAAGVGNTVVRVNPWNVGLGTTAYNISFTSGKVGIGTTVAESLLDVYGNASFAGDLDVDGHTALDNVSIAGVSTFAGNIILPDGVSAKFGTDLDGEVKHTGSNLQIQETTGNIQITNYANDKDVVINTDDGSGGTATYFKADGSTGETILYNYGNEKIKTTSSGIDVTGNVVSDGLTVDGDTDLNGDLDVDGHTNLDNVSIAGVSTFAGNIILGDSIVHDGDTDTKIVFTDNTIDFQANGASILEVTSHVKLPDNSQIQLGNSGTNDFVLVHDGTNNIINCGNNGILFYRSITHKLQSVSAEDMLVANTDGSVELYHDGTKRLETSSVGVSIPQDLDVDGHTNLDNVSVAGFSTFTGAITITNANPAINFTDNNDNPDYQIGNLNGVFRIRDTTNSENRLVVNTDGHVDVLGNLDVGAGIDVTGNIIATGQIKVDGDGGSKYISVGDNEDFKVYHDATGPTIFSDANNQGLKIQAKNLNFTEYTGSTTRFRINDDGHVDVTGNLDVGSNIKLGNAGVVTATAFHGSSQIGIQSASTQIGVGITQLNFVGTGNTFAVNGTTVDISIAGGDGGANVSVSSNPPNSPDGGDLWWDSDVGELFIYYADGDSNQWVETSGGSETVTVSDDAPSSPNSGDLWWESDTGQLKIYYNDGDSAQWVDANAGVLSKLTVWETTSAGINTVSSVGIGTTNPNNPLTVHGSGNHIYLKDTATNNIFQIRSAGGVAEFNSFGTGGARRDFVFNQYATEVLRINSSGNATLAGTLTQNSSDIRLKTNIQPITNSLEKVKSLSGFTYNWNKTAQDIGFEGEEYDELQVGLSAQDVEKIQPEVVKPAPIDNNFKTIQYEKLVPLLVEAIKEQQEQIEALEEEVAALKSS